MKTRIINKAPHISDQEINDKMDFQNLLQERNSLMNRIKSKRLFRLKVIFVITLTILLATAAGFFFIDTPPEKNRFEAPIGQLEPDANNISLIIGQTNDSIKYSKIESITTTKKEPSNPNIEKKIVLVDEQKGLKEKKLSKPISHKNSFTEAYPLVGMDSLLNYFNSNLRYPREELSKPNPVFGTTLVFFTIDTTGKATNIRINNSLGPQFNKEAIRLIKNMPPWEPARFNNKLTETHLSIPLSFKPTEAESNY